MSGGPPDTGAGRAPGRLRAPGVGLRRWLFLGLVAGTTALGAWMMLGIVRAGGVTALEVLILALFAGTFGWIAVAFWTGVVGFLLEALRLDPLTLRRAPCPADADGPVRSLTALVMPVHNEDPDRVLAGLRAVLDSLEETGRGGRFHLHLLSDTTDLDLARREEAAWRRFRADAADPGRLHYRRRPDNTGRKAGNIAEFSERCGDDYDFMVVLDADSLMSGETLVELVRTMEASPRTGLIQTVPVPARQETLFGRLVQFAGSLYGPALAAGQSFWQAESANYWGHNAIVRLAAFRDHCRLPVLPGSPPMGGRILSHDFVEAALLRRAGWEVYLVTSLGGSFEEVPGNVVDYARRDRRWAQGSLQHLRLLSLEGLHGVSRLHFTLGAMGYLSSVLWLLMLLASTAYVLLPGGAGAALAGPGVPEGLRSLFRTEPPVSLLVVTAVVLFLPRLLALGLALLRRRGCFGGAARLSAGALLEVVFAVVVAPVMMVYHAWFVAEVLAGRDVAWEAQVREGRVVGWREAWRKTAGITAAGSAWAALTLHQSPVFFLWLTPIFVGLLVAAPLTRWTSSRRLGAWTRRLGLLLVPSETAPLPVMEAARRPRGGRKARTAPGAPAPASGVEAPAPDVEAPAPDVGAPAPDVSDPPAHPSGPPPGAGTWRAERGLFELGRGRPLFVSARDSEPGGSALVAPVEGLGRETLAWLRRVGEGRLRLALTDVREVPGSGEGSGGRTGNGRPPSGGNGGPAGDRHGSLLRGVSVPLSDPDRPESVLRMVGGPGPPPVERRDAEPVTAAEAAALTLLALGRLLPAAVSVRVEPTAAPELAAALEDGRVLEAEAAGIRKLSARAGAEVVRVSDAPVPLPGTEDARFVLFRETSGLREHVAVLVGEPSRWPDPVPVRLHSACLTGDLFGSLRCDCGDQLRGSLGRFSGRGGVLLYLDHGGRDLGTDHELRPRGNGNGDRPRAHGPVRAPGLTARGPEERRYEAAVEILGHLGIGRIALLTNSPEKVRAMEEGGIRVQERRPLHGTLSRHNLPHVLAKARHAGHWLDDMLASRGNGGRGDPATD